MAKKALVGINTTIMNGKVLDVVAIGATFDVHTNLTWVDCPDSVVNTWSYDGSTFKNRDTRTADDFTKEAWEGMRRFRRLLLKDSDWVVTKSLETGIGISTEWKNYRQALRDLPANTSDPNNVTYPTKPS